MYLMKGFSMRLLCTLSFSVNCVIPFFFMVVIRLEEWSSKTAGDIVCPSAIVVSGVLQDLKHSSPTLFEVGVRNVTRESWVDVFAIHYQQFFCVVR